MFSDSEPSPRLELAVFIVLALIAVGPALGAGVAVGDGVDMYGTLWFYWWIKDCIVHLRDPSFTDLFFYPLGKDIFAHTGDNFVDAVFAAPFVAALGVPGFTAPFVAAMLVANAWTFRLFARDQLGPGWAAFGAAALWEVNPFTIFEITCGRYTQAFLPFFALAIAWFVRVERGPGWRGPVLLGLFVGLQGWTYWFSGWFLVFMLAPAALYALWRSDDRRGLALRYLGAALVCLVVIAPAAVAMFRAEASGGVPGLANVERVSLFEPPHQLANNVSKTLHGLIKAERHGSPLLTQRIWMAIAAAWLIFGAQRRRWAPGALVLLIFAIGPVFELPSVRGGVVMPWYMAAYHYLPYFDRLWFPYRMMVGVFFVLCLGAGTLLLRVERARGAKLTAAAIVVALAATAIEQHKWQIFPFVTREMRAPALIHWLAKQPDGAVMHLPFGITQPAIVWQTLHHKPLFGGMGENAKLLWPDGYKDRMKSSMVKALIAAARDPEEPIPAVKPVHRERFLQDGFRWVILHRDLAESDSRNWGQHRRLSAEDVEQVGIQATRRLVGLLGEPVAVDGVLVIWDLRGGSVPTEALRPDDTKLYTRTWVSERPPVYEQVLRETGRMESPK
ncbi:MAG: hypothetical protein RIT28_4587 [Pseudomonadota bacterium]